MIGTEKTCTKCGVTQGVNQFTSDKGKRDGRSNHCRSCRSIAKTEYRAKNREKEVARSTAWQLANKERASEIHAAWRARNPEKVIAKALDWQAKNYEKTIVYGQNRRARVRGGGKLSPDISFKLMKLQRGKCACCCLPLGDDYHLDHIMPLALGGTNTDDNIQLLHAKCNLQKHAKHPVEFMQSKGKLL